MVLNADGVITKNKHISLWPITLMINEIPLPTRRYSESIILGGVLPALQHPSNKLFKTVMDIIYEQCIRLEAGVKFFLPDEGERTLKFYLIATWLAAVKIPTTTSRRFRSIKKLERYKANEFRSLMHHGSTVLLRAKLPKYRRHFALLLAAVNIASKDVIRDCDVKLVKELLQQYVKDWQKIFGLRYMSYNVHSLLHVYESIEFLGPLYMYSTFNFEDLVEEPTKQVNLLQTKVNNVTTTIPNIYIRMHSTCLILRSPSQIKKKHSYRLA
ncbi:unnamed protein product [Rotaria sp. Silwood2]|nr:unnamed protein product [Rotaria sp. Silwood2]